MSDVVGEIFLDTDGRSYQRRIRIIGIRDELTDRGVVGTAKRVWPKIVRTFAWEAEPTVRYTYEVIANAGNPETVGRMGSISEKTLRSRYRQVSH